jgi:TetR/AcrR family transcriptional repressor of mexJK operon
LPESSSAGFLLTNTNLFFPVLLTFNVKKSDGQKVNTGRRSVKPEQIVEVAIRRFSHFGIQKTNLSEIAVDLGVTKPALFYYFPDKASLVAAVEERIITEYFDALETQFTGASTVAVALLKLVEVRMSFLEKYFMLASRLEGADAPAGGKTIDEVKQNMQEREVELLARLFERGVNSGELKPLEPLKTAGLLLHTVSALAHCVRDKSIPPDQNAVRDVFLRQKEVLQLFYNGLKK